MFLRPVRTSQPQGPARIDWSNPITRGLVFAWTPDSFNSPYSPSPVGVYHGTGTSRRVGRFGKAIQGGASGDGLGFAINMTAPSVASGVSFLLIGGYDSAAFSVAATSPAGWLRNNNGSAAFCIVNCTGGTNRSVNITPTASQWVGDGVLVATTNAAKNVGKSLVNGTPYSTTTNAADGAATANTVNILQSVVGDRSSVTKWNQNGYLIAQWVRELSDLEMKSLSDNPWQLFASDSKALWTPAETISGAGSTITAASGSSITSTATGQAQAASTQTAATGTSTSSTLTGAAVVSATVTAANGTSTTGTLAAGGSSAATMTPAGGTSTASTMVGSSTSGANVADGPPIGGFVAIGQLGPASPVASGSTIAPASGSSIAETLTSSTSAAATIASAAGTSVTSTMVGASTSGTAATMTAAGGTSITSTMTSSAISSAVMVVNSSSSITSTLVGFPPTENNADTHDGYFHKLWAKLAKKPEYQLEILEERLEEIAEEIKQVKAIPVVSKSAITPQLPQFDAQAKLLQALILESARIRRDIEDEEEAEMLLML